VASHNAGDRRDYYLSLSTGAAHYDPRQPQSLDELIRQGDAAMYQEKASKPSRGALAVPDHFRRRNTGLRLVGS